MQENTAKEKGLAVFDGTVGLYLPDVPVRPFSYMPPHAGLEVLHADEHLVVVGKPHGLLTVPGREATLADCVITRLTKQFPTATTVHRLDLDTSGVMVFALNRNAHRHLGLQFEKRRIKKRYIARVAGDVVGKRGRISMPLTCDWPNRPRQMVCYESGREAVTDWTVSAREEGATRVTLSPRTGRSHQLRVHLARMGHPILGDPLYAPDAAFEAVERLQLHAESIGFRHPDGGEPMSFEVACPF